MPEIERVRTAHPPRGCEYAVREAAKSLRFYIENPQNLKLQSAFVETLTDAIVNCSRGVKEEEE